MWVQRGPKGSVSLENQLVRIPDTTSVKMASIFFWDQSGSNAMHIMNITFASSC